MSRNRPAHYRLHFAHRAQSGPGPRGTLAGRTHDRARRLGPGMAGHARWWCGSGLAACGRGPVARLAKSGGVRARYRSLRPGVVTGTGSGWPCPGRAHGTSVRLRQRGRASVEHDQDGCGCSPMTGEVTPTAALLQCRSVRGLQVSPEVPVTYPSGLAAGRPGAQRQLHCR